MSGTNHRYEASSFKYLIYYSFSLFGCLFVYLCPINAKTAEPIDHKFCVGPKIQKIVFKSFLFSQNFENARKNIMKSANFLFLFHTVQREDAHR